MILLARLLVESVAGRGQGVCLRVHGIPSKTGPNINLLAPEFYNLIKINHQPDATIFQFIILTFVYSSTCFGRFSTHHQELNDCSGSLWFYLHIVVIVVLCSWSGRPVIYLNCTMMHGFTKLKLYI